MAGRALVLGLCLLALAGLWLIVQGWAWARRRSRVGRAREPELAAGAQTIVFFTADYCTVCKYRQKPALDALSRSLDGAVRVVELDAVERADVAQRFGVLSLPTTAVLAPDGTVAAINYGFAPREQLEAQLGSVAAAS